MLKQWRGDMTWEAYVWQWDFRMQGCPWAQERVEGEMLWIGQWTVNLYKIWVRIRLAVLLSPSQRSWLMGSWQRGSRSHYLRPCKQCKSICTPIMHETGARFLWVHNKCCHSETHFHLCLLNIFHTLHEPGTKRSQIPSKRCTESSDRHSYTYHTVL
jgi:hypothetical protein